MGHGRAGAMGFTDPSTGVLHNVKMDRLYLLALHTLCVVPSVDSRAWEQTWVYHRGRMSVSDPAVLPALYSVYGLYPEMSIVDGGVQLRTIVLNGCNTLDCIPEHRTGVRLLLRAGVSDFLLVGAVQAVDWANGSMATLWLLHFLLMHNRASQGDRFLVLTAGLHGIGGAYHAEQFQWDGSLMAPTPFSC